MLLLHSEALAVLFAANGNVQVHHTGQQSARRHDLPDLLGTSACMPGAEALWSQLLCSLLVASLCIPLAGAILPPVYKLPTAFPSLLRRAIACIPESLKKYCMTDDLLHQRRSVFQRVYVEKF